MRKTTTTITVLTIAFLVAVQVQADLLTHTFDFRIAPTSKNTNMSSVADALSLTATDNGKGGIDFVLSSTWTGNNGGPGIIMSHGYNYNDNTEMGYAYGNTNSSAITKNHVSLNNYGTYDEDGKITSMFTNTLTMSGERDDYGYVTKWNSPYLGGRLGTGGFSQEEGSDMWTNMFTLNYDDGYNWDSFLDLFVEDNPLTTDVNEAENGFYLAVTLGELDGTRSDTSFATFDTAIPAVGMGEGNNATPEPATLAILGLGLAGLGLVSRRHRK